MLKKLVRSKPIVFLQGLSFSALTTLLYLISANATTQFYIFAALLGLIILTIHLFLFTKQAKEELASAKTWLILGLTAGFCLVWGGFLCYIIFK